MGLIGKRRGKVVKGAGNPGSTGSDAIGGSLSKNDHWYLQEGFGFSGDPGAGTPPAYGDPTGHTATGGVISDYAEPGGNVYRAHVFQSSGLLCLIRIVNRSYGLLINIKLLTSTSTNEQ